MNVSMWTTVEQKITSNEFEIATAIFELTITTQTTGGVGSRGD